MLVVRVGGKQRHCVGPGPLHRLVGEQLSHYCRINAAGEIAVGVGVGDGAYVAGYPESHIGAFAVEKPCRYHTFYRTVVGVVVYPLA